MDRAPTAGAPHAPSGSNGARPFHVESRGRRRWRSRHHAEWCRAGAAVTSRAADRLESSGSFHRRERRAVAGDVPPMDARAWKVRAAAIVLAVAGDNLPVPPFLEKQVFAPAQSAASCPTTDSLPAAVR